VTWREAQGTIGRRARLAALVSAALFGGVSAQAQPAVDATLGFGLEALRPAGEAADARATLSGRIAPEVLFAAGRGRVGYALDGGSYSTPGDWSFLAQRLETSLRFDAGSSKLYLGAKGVLRRNGDAWADADYDAIGGFARLELRPTSGLTLRAGVGGDRRAFPDLQALDQTELSGFASAKLSLETRTTLIAEAQLGGKSYAGETLALPTEGATQPAAGGQGGGRRGAGMGPSVRVTPEASFVATSASTRARQWGFLARVAQGLGERTGLSVEYQQRDVSGRVPPALVATPAGFFDDGVYDDPYASASKGLGLLIRHAFASGARAEVFGDWERRRYPGFPPLDLGGEPIPGELRTDKIVRAGALAELPLLPDRTGAFGVSLEVAYSYVRQSSNDAFYNYRSHAGSLLLRVAR
jgi:hypothetical protein